MPPVVAAAVPPEQHAAPPAASVLTPVTPVAAPATSPPSGQPVPAWMIPVAPLDDAAPTLPQASPAGAPSAPEPPRSAGDAPLRRDDAAQATPSRSAEASPGAPDPGRTADPLGGATTLVLRVVTGIGAMDDLNGRKVAVSDSDAGRQAAIAATFRGRSVTPDLLPLPSDEAEQQLKAGTISAIATLADDATAAKATDPVLKIRLEPYVVGSPRQPPS